MIKMGVSFANTYFELEHIDEFLFVQEYLIKNDIQYRVDTFTSGIEVMGEFGIKERYEELILLVKQYRRIRKVVR